MMQHHEQTWRGSEKWKHVHGTPEINESVVQFDNWSLKSKAAGTRDALPVV